MKRATYPQHKEVTQWLISIHALMKRATFTTLKKSCKLDDFNPRPHEEGDVVHNIKRRFYIRFQSTPS